MNGSTQIASARRASEDAPIGFLPPPGQTLNGGAGNDTFAGSPGPDTIDGAGGIDRMNYEHSAAAVSVNLATGLGSGGDADGDVLSNIERVFGSAFDDTLIGDGNDNVLLGMLGANRLEGGGGNDILHSGLGGTATMLGGAGNDSYVATLADTIIEYEGEGHDTVFAASDFTLGDGLEDLSLVGFSQSGAGNGQANVITGNVLADLLRGLGGADRLVGGLGADTLDGGEGADTLDGGAGDDLLIGGGENDTYLIDNSFELIVESIGEGAFDVVYSSVSFALRDNIEQLILTGSENAQAIGNGLDNLIIGNAGSNFIDGGGGFDGLIGGAGDDYYRVDTSFDKLVEQSGEGYDSVESSASFAMSANIEALLLAGDAVQAIGNDLTNRIVGNAVANFIDGGAGADTLTGGGGADVFWFKAGELGGDLITDFNLAEDSAVFAGFGAGAFATQAGADAWLITYAGGASTAMLNFSANVDLAAAQVSFV